MVLLGISYDTWKKICVMYFSQKKATKKLFLQWYPFTKLSPEDETKIIDEEFFNKYIQSFSFIFFPSVIHQTSNYIQKTDGSFRDSSLIGPILFLVLQSIGMEIFKNYKSIRPCDFSVYYAGNYDKRRPIYKQDYDAFFKKINECIGYYQYFIKTDITNFFSNINIDILIEQVDKNCNSNKVIFSQAKLQIFKELFKYCGNGKFPIVENSLASSYLATVVYLDEIDKRLYEYISEKITGITSFHIMRYVDDLYILFSSNLPIEECHKVYNEIRNVYSSILKEFNLSLNQKKCCFKEAKEINNELKKSLYDEYFNGKKYHIEELFKGAFLLFLKDLSNNLLLDNIDIETYNKLIEQHFSSDDIEFTASEVFNYFVYEDKKELQSKEVINEIMKLIKKSISFVSLDPKRLTVMLIKTKEKRIIKEFLNQLFNKDKMDKWNLYDTTMVVAYLIQRGFMHGDLLKLLSYRNPELFKYYNNHCKCSTLCNFSDEKINALTEVSICDFKAHYLFFMYICEKKRLNYMIAFAYYKNFFDRITADLDYVYIGGSKKKPEYKRFYKEPELIKFYDFIDNSQCIIKKAHKLRNANPLSHASSELLDHDESSMDLCKSIEDLHSLILEYVCKK